MNQREGREVTSIDKTDCELQREEETSIDKA